MNELEKQNDEMKKQLDELKELIQKSMKIHPKTLQKINNQLNMNNNGIINNNFVVQLGYEDFNNVALPVSKRISLATFEISRIKLFEIRGHPKNS